MVALFLGGAALFPLAALIALVCLRRPSLVWRTLSLATIIAGAALTGLAAALSLISDTVETINLYQLATNLALSFKLDRLAAFFILIVCLVVICVGLYSFKYIEHGADARRRHWLIALMSLFILGMVMVVAAANFFSLIFFWEIMSLSSFFMVLYEYELPQSRKAGLFYLVMTQFSTAFLLLGALLFYRYTGSFEIASATGLAGPVATLIFGAFFIGFGTKAGVIPFHKWLPYAHSAVPSNVSALMSGVMIKVAIYGLARLLLDVFQPQLSWGILLLVFGTVSAVLGVIYALKEHDIKNLLAYHSIENIGIIVIGLGLYVIFNYYQLPALAVLSLAGALFHSLNHALFKSLLFMTAGSVVQATNTRNIEHMGGLARRMPVTAVIFLVGAAAISALPPLNGFASEIMLFQAYVGFFKLPDPFTAILLFTALAGFALMSALAAACFVKAFAMVFLARSRSPAAAQAKEAPALMLIGPGILAACCVGLGVLVYQIQKAIGLNLPVPDMLPVGLIIAAVFGLALLLVKATGAKVRREETWACGILSQNERQEYTASGFSEPIITIFSPIFRTKKHVERRYWDPDKTVIKSVEGEITTFKFFEERLYRPIVNLTLKVARYISARQNADLDTFVLYAFIAIVLILAIAGWWL